MKNLFVLSLAALSLATGGAVEIHVAITGNDANPGTPAQPLATFATAQALARRWPGAGQALARRWPGAGQNFKSQTICQKSI